MNVQQQILSKANSFDHYLKGFYHEKPLYAYPILVRGIIEIIGTFGEKNGFYLHNDKIIPNSIHDDYSVMQLRLTQANRFYCAYEDDSQAGRICIFYSATECTKLYKYLTSIGLSMSVNEKELIGTVLVGSEKARALILITSMKITSPQVYDYDFVDNMEAEKYSFTKHNDKPLLWAFSHDITRNIPNYELAKNNSLQNTKILVDFIKKNYNSFSDEQKAECAFLDIGEFVPIPNTLEEQEKITIANIRNLFNIIRTNGLCDTVTIDSINGLKIYKTIKWCFSRDIWQAFKKISIGLKLPYDTIIPLSIDLLYLNGIYDDVDGNPTGPWGLWLYYVLYKYRKSCSYEDLPFVNSLLIWCLLRNEKTFTKIISDFRTNWNIKIHMWDKYRDKYRGILYSWREYDEDDKFVKELIYFFSNDQHSWWAKMPKEQRFLLFGQYNSDSDYFSKITLADLLGENDNKIEVPYSPEQRNFDINLDKAMDDFHQDSYSWEVHCNEMTDERRGNCANELFLFLDYKITSGDIYFKDYCIY